MTTRAADPVAAVTRPSSSRVRWTVIVPQKDLRRAKSRLETTHQRRVECARAMLVDTVSAILDCEAVRRVVVVCERLEDTRGINLSRVHRVEFEALGHNSSIEAGERLARSHFHAEHIVVVPADLPSLHPIELQRALDLAATTRRSFVRDIEGSGTTLLAATGPQQLLPLYGSGSADAHSSTGAVELNKTVGLWSLRDDVDDLDALRRSVATGRAEHTRAVLEQLADEGSTLSRSGVSA